jgi:hypothetical protein
MITLNSTYSLIAKLGEAATTQPDYIVFYGKPYIKREAGTATEVRSREVAAGSMNSTTNVTLLAATTTGTSDRYTVDSVSICNKDTIEHTVSVSLYDGTNERRIVNAFHVPANATLVVDAEGARLLADTDAPLTLSESTNGKGVKVAATATATATAGTLIHTAVAGTTQADEITLYAYNGDTVTRTLTVEFGGASVPDQNIIMDIPSKAGLTLVCPELLLNNGLTVRAFASAANVIVLYGEYRRVGT